MPMLFTGWAPQYVARPDFLPGFAPTLRPSAAARNDQDLAERVRVPCSARSGLERHSRAE